MKTLRKALSLVLCAVMMFTTLCFFPIVNTVTEAAAAVVSTGSRTAFYVPEVIYLYPEVSSWTAATKTPFQYYVGNTVDTENIYNAPVADANLDTTGKIYFAAEDGMSDVSLSVKYLDLLGQYLAEEAYGTVEFTKEDKGSYYLFTVTGGVSPELQANINGVYIEWCITYKTALGEEKAAFNYSYIYKPYVVPYGAAVRTEGNYGDVNVYAQQITWVSGVHSIALAETESNRVSPIFRTVEESTASYHAFSPFLSKDNKAYAYGTEVSGAAGIEAGGYNAVFAGSDPALAYFYAGQSGAELTKSQKVMSWFKAGSASSTVVSYPLPSFTFAYTGDYNTQYAVTHVYPLTKGQITVDTSRYDNLNEVPNLSVGMMITDTDVTKGGQAATTNATWHVADATGKIQLATGQYTTSGDALSVFGAKNSAKVFVEKTALTAPFDLGIKYAGEWNSEIKSDVSDYTVKSYFESVDEENDHQIASAAVSLAVNQLDKSALRAEVNRAASYLGALGVKENWNSYYYDINYIDPDTGASAWGRFRAAYINACGALSNVDLAGALKNIDESFVITAETYEGYRLELKNSLDALLSGKGLRVYFDVNHDDIGVNLWINPAATNYSWNSAKETVTLNSSEAASITYGTTPFTPDEGEYAFSVNQLSGSFNGNGCVVLDTVNASGANTGEFSTGRYNFDFTGTTSSVFNYKAEYFTDIEGLKFWNWYNEDVGAGVYDNFEVQIKIEKGNKTTAYSPVGKIVGTTYGTLPVVEREGYLFAGWCTDESLETVVDENSAVSARILYAKWEKAQYNIVFDKNGADGGEMAEQTFLYDESEKLNVNKYTRTGYVFSGWKDADGNSYTDGQSVLNLTSEHQSKITLYAQWTPNQYSVAFDGNTGIGGLGMANAQYDTPFNLPANYFIKTGYTFVGWADSADGEAIYDDEEEVKNLTSDVNGSVTLYAVWKANTFTVSFDKNTGTGEMADVDVVYDSEVSLPECGFTKTGYTFIGWSDTADGTNIITDVQYDNLMTEEGDSITLYAIWSENSYTLSFNANGGEGENIPATDYGYEATVPLPKDVFTKTGYVLSGWASTADGEQIYKNGETVTHINADRNGTVTLYAVWSPIEYTVKLDANTGAGEMAEINAIYNESAVLPANTFTKEGYHFIGWATSAGGGVVYKDGATIKNLTAENLKEVTLYAVWEINVYTVTFVYLNSAGSLVRTAVKVKHGEAAVVPSDFTRTPYLDTEKHSVFTGWNADITNITSDITVQAKYPSSAEVAHTMEQEIQDSTCVKLGYIRNYCTACTYATVEDIPMKSHEWNEGETAVEPGCLTNGSFVYTCKNGCGSTKADVIDPLGHDFAAFPAKEASCSEEGNITHKHCERCEECFAADAPVDAPESDALTESEVKIPKLPHTAPVGADCSAPCNCTACGEEFSIAHTYKEAVTPPTCTEGGYTVFTCDVCGDSYRGNEVQASGHTDGEWIVTTAPTCTEKGVEKNRCAVCGVYHKTRDVEASGHTPGDWVETTPAECEKTGEETLYCSVCKAVIRTRIVAPKGHGETKWEITREAECESTGRNSKLCLDCGKELAFEIIPAKEHIPGAAATCETAQRCTVCNKVLVDAFDHKWDEGKVTKEPTETEEGIRIYTCLNDASHTKTEKIPVRIVITIPPIPADGTVDFDADENGYLGNINNKITVEEGMDYTVTVSDPSVISMDSAGNMMALKDGECVITVKTTDGKFEKSFTAAVRMLNKVTFDIRGTLTEVMAYAGDKVTAPEVSSYEAGGFTYRFKSWTVNGVEVSDFTVTGEMTFVAVFTSSCYYKDLDKVTEIFYNVISGSYDNADKLKIYKNDIETAKADIEEFSKDRDTRDSAEQPIIDAVTDKISGLISALYPEENARIFIVGESTVALGSVTKIKAYLSPVNTLIANGIWTSSDDSIGFFANGKFHAVRTGTVTVTVSTGSLSASKEITIEGGSASRVIMFDALLSNANYIVEGSLVLKETTNLFWAPDAPIHFRVITDGTFESYRVYVNKTEVFPDATGTYTIPANTGDAHVRIEGVAYEEDDGTKISFWEMIRNFFKKIADFFANLFGG